jgi:hemerythrin
MSVNWHAEMKIGIDVVDDDHRELFRIIKEFEDEAQRRSGAVGDAALGAILARLQAYARDHFEREEMVQLEAGYDGYEENKRQHEELNRTLAVFLGKFNDGSLGEARVATDKMIEFLGIWLGSHILKTDRKMRGRILPWAG